MLKPKILKDFFQTANPRESFKKMRIHNTIGFNVTYLAASQGRRRPKSSGGGGVVMWWAHSPLFWKGLTNPPKYRWEEIVQLPSIPTALNLCTFFHQKLQNYLFNCPIPYVKLKHHFTALSKALSEKQVPNVCCDVVDKKC